MSPVKCGPRLKAREWRDLPNEDLTRAELCFQNGEYTRALKIAIQAIENMHPGIYEKLVAQKDPAVMNQVQ